MTIACSVPLDEREHGRVLINLDRAVMLAYHVHEKANATTQLSVYKYMHTTTLHVHTVITQTKIRG